MARLIYADSGSATGSEAHLKCLYTHSMRNKKDKLEALVFSQSCDIIGISETWWDESNIMTGVLGWRVIGCSGGIGSTGKVEVLHSM